MRPYARCHCEEMEDMIVWRLPFVCECEFMRAAQYSCCKILYWPLPFQPAFLHIATNSHLQVCQELPAGCGHQRVAALHNRSTLFLAVAPDPQRVDVGVAA